MAGIADRGVGKVLAVCKQRRHQSTATWQTSHDAICGPEAAVRWA